MYFISSKSHFLSSYFHRVVLLSTGGASIFAPQVRRCQQGAAAIPCQGAAGSVVGHAALQPEWLAACGQRLGEICQVYVPQ